MPFPVLFKRPSAFLPVAMSAVALAVVVVAVLFYGAGRRSDEGIAAHLWQLLIAGQVPLVAFFVLKWLPRAPRAALPVLALQAVALLAALAPVYFLHL